MLNIKNKFIVFIIAFIVLIIGAQIFISPSSARDTNSYLSLVKGQCTLNTLSIEKEKKYSLKKGDTIETKNDSIAVIEWGDGSITRISENSQIELRENTVFENNSKVQIAFALLKWKSWSKVTSLLSWDAFFKEYIDDLEAWVRGTEFEVNKDKWYVAVKSHEVTMTNKTGKKLTVGQNQALSLTTFSIIEIEKFISEIQDKAWQEINKQMDSELFISLKHDFLIVSKANFQERFLSWFIPKYKVLVAIKNKKSIDSLTPMIDTLSSQDKTFILSKVKQIFAEVNFASVTDDIYKDKVYFRKLLFVLSENEEDKKAITRATVYDVQDMIESKNYTYLVESLADLKNSEKYLKELNINFDTIFQFGATIPDAVKKLIQDKVWSLKDMFPNIQFDISSGGSIIENLNNGAKGAINNALDMMGDKITNSIPK
jgi:FecR protein